MMRWSLPGIQTRIYLVLLLILMGGFSQLAAQTPQPDSLNTRDPIDVNFLFSYYAQDGENSAVTGGKGTQELSDIAGKVIVHVPMDSLTILNVETSLNVYSSASTDRIDFAMSSASSQDAHLEGAASVDRSLAGTRMGLNFGAGGSIESDYISASVGGGWSLASKDQSRLFSVNGRAFFDRWIVYLPVEFRKLPNAFEGTDKRRSYSLGLSYSQIINPRMQAGISAEAVLQSGLLSTPFHRVYTSDDTLNARLEKLPDHRFKVPLAVRLNYFLGDQVILRFYYRFYWDDFGIRAHTMSLETPVRIGNALTIFPFYRFHTQTASEYFQAFGKHAPDAVFVTSDYDLSAFRMQKFGAGIQLSPVYGILRFGKRTGSGFFRNMGVRYARYIRSDGLRAWNLTGEFGFRVP
jgi:hypothetical protein